MACVTAKNPQNGFAVKAYQGDNKTLLAFNFDNEQRAANLAGFSIQAQPPGKPAYFLLNDLLFPTPNKHAVDQNEPPNSSANAPFQKYRWTHFTGQYHQGLNPEVGPYHYTVTPRYFDKNGNMLALDPTLSASVTINVGSFKKGSLSLGFTRGYMQSQAFEHHFGMHAQLMPSGKPLQFDTSAAAGTDSTGQSFSYEDEYAWMGESARVQVFDVLNQVLNDPTLSLKVFAYDLNEPDVVTILLKLAAAGRVRVILDNASLHTNKAGSTPEDQFTALFNKQKKNAIVRGHFARFSHDKIFIVSKNGAPIRVLTGSTNFSITGLYVNANHVLVFDDKAVASKYSQVFEESWNDLSKKDSAPVFAASPLATTPFTPQVQDVSKMVINFSPHSTTDASKILNGIVTRVNQETGAGVENGNVIFAVMQLTGGNNNPVYDALNNIHESQSVYSYGISDAPQKGTFLYQPSSPQGVLVTGKPGKTTLPPPFDQVPNPPGHEIHDKFVVCGLNRKDPVVYCGSSNLALGGEESNGDNLLEIHDADVATVFAIEALGLIDHYNFLDRYGQAKAVKTAKQSAAAKKAAAKKVPAKASATKKSVKANATKPRKIASKRIPAQKAAKKSQARRPAAKRAASSKRAKKK